MQTHVRNPGINARPRDRRGTMLILFALFLFGFMALAALVIDLGFARLTQLQMQSAADSAAMEGLWLQGRESEFSTPVDFEEWRRPEVREHVRRIFDDNLEPNDGDPMNFGAGPNLTFSGGIPLTDEFNASETIEFPPVTPVYKPRLASNLDNEKHGDMVAGTFHLSPSEAELSDPAFDAKKFHSENRDFDRLDFDNQAETSTAFLVRLRRSNGRNPLDIESEISSSGPSVPLLFGRGATLHPDYENGNIFDLRGRGMTIRATGIANGEHAKSVGVRHPHDWFIFRDAPINDQPRISGLAPFMFDTSQFFVELESQESKLLEFDDSGLLVEATDPSNEIGRMIDDSNLVVIGDQLPGAAESVMLDHLRAVELPRISVYVPVSGEDGLSERVIGFRLLQMEKSANVNQFTVRIPSYQPHIALENASAVFSRTIADGIDDWQDLMTQHNALNNPLLAPASVR